MSYNSKNNAGTCGTGAWNQTPQIWTTSQIIPSATCVSDYYPTDPTLSHRGSREQSCNSRYATHKSGGAASSASYNSKYARSQDKKRQMANVRPLSFENDSKSGYPDRSGDEMKMMPAPTQRLKVRPWPTLMTSLTGHTLRAPGSHCILADMLSPGILESTLPPYSESSNYVSPSKGPLRSSHRAPCQSPTWSASRTAISPPSYGGRSEQEIPVYNTDNIYSQIEMDPVFHRAPIEVGRAAVAASRESKGSKRQLKDHKSQLRNQQRTQVEEFGITTKDDFGRGLLEEIFAIGGSSGCPSTQGMFNNTGLKVSDA